MAIVTAVGVASGTLSPAMCDVVKRVQAAMTRAITECNAAGVTDPVEVKAEMMAARERVLGEG